MDKSSLNMAALCLLAAAGTAYADADKMQVGKQVYEASCSHCHDSGKEGAPVLADMVEWTDRTQILWSDVHLQHVDDGFFKDPGDGSMQEITADQMEAATNYMVSIAGKK